ncbi:hypothetical protein B0H17DRAFT_1196626 [Mycena rosella]|uniref:Uncharacterized protein n=1 Tax=Mycena rosella TaxID=1033263 RepID=A0AAD7DT14_MYCRO|nr:hypothetical protein B0H17DRAFT_1196626 [Mycena rosella]
MHATLPWPVSPEFEDALALATQRHLAQPPTAPSSPFSSTQQQSLHPRSLAPSSAPPSDSDVPRSASLMMKTRVAVRDKTPHRFQVVPLRDAAQNREKTAGTKLIAPQPPAPWIRQLAVLRPSGVGLGLGVPIQRPTLTCAPDTPERGRGRERKGGDVFCETPAARKGALRGLQGLSPRRAPPSPEGKENRTPHTPPKHATRRRREYTIEAALENVTYTGAGDTTITASTTAAELPATPAAMETSESADLLPQSAPATPSRHVKALSDTNDITMTLKALTAALPSRHIKACSGTDDITMTLNTLTAALPSRHIKACSGTDDITMTLNTLTGAALPSRHIKSCSDTGDITTTLNALAFAPHDAPAPAPPKRLDAPRPLSRHFKSPSLGTLPRDLLSAAPTPPNDTPRVRCRKRTNTLSAGTNSKRHGVYARETLDFGAVAPPARPETIASTYSLGALLAAYSHDSLPSLYSQDSFVEGTRALRVRVRALPGEAGGCGHPHAILVELMREVDVAIGEWL